MNDFLNKEKLSFSVPLNIILKEETDSTNLDAKRMGEKGEDDSLIIALSQTAGKGRLNRSFFSPGGSGLYMSLLLHTKLKANEILYLTTSAAVAVAETLEEVSGKKTYIKWVNDIYQNNRKVCGILANAVFKSCDTPSYVIIGIGINLSDPECHFPKEIENKAASVFGNKQVSADIRTEIINKAVNRILNYLNNDIAAHISEYKKRNYLKGKKVTFTKDGINFTADVTGIDDNCHLLLKTDNGKNISLLAGEVSVKTAE